MSLADKCIVVGCFVCWDYDKILMETGKFSDNIRVTENGLVSGVDRIMCQTSILVLFFIRHASDISYCGSSAVKMYINKRVFNLLEENSGVCCDQTRKA